ncbi:hypothetical protein B0H15DRAFT_952010 [Mycena belliarum]|uniref:Uncharacterized protein n=1 Tax=Mycena belliarum TaxID=1033014 RepID=A0AAD6XLS4_9AGAR|nr:hypothetical protein B0H15DRAFT_952010 [Mycena belliae]
MAEHPYNCSTRLGAIETPVLGDRIPVAGYTILWELSSPLIWLRVSRAPEMCTSTGSTLYLKTSPFATKFHPNTDAPWHHNGAHREGLQMKIGEVLWDLGSKVRKFVTYYPSSLLASLYAAAMVVLTTEHPLWLLLATIIHHLPLRPSFNSFGASSRSPRAVTWQSSPVGGGNFFLMLSFFLRPSTGCGSASKWLLPPKHLHMTARCVKKPSHRAVLPSHFKLSPSRCPESLRRPQASPAPTDFLDPRAATRQFHRRSAYNGSTLRRARPPWEKIKTSSGSLRLLELSFACVHAEDNPWTCHALGDSLLSAHAGPSQRRNDHDVPALGGPRHKSVALALPPHTAGAPRPARPSPCTPGATQWIQQLWLHAACTEAPLDLEHGAIALVRRPVSAKILRPSQEDTPRLVKRIVNTGADHP